MIVPDLTNGGYDNPTIVVGPYKDHINAAWKLGNNFDKEEGYKLIDTLKNNPVVTCHETGETLYLDTSSMEYNVTDALLTVNFRKVLKSQEEINDHIDEWNAKQKPVDTSKLNLDEYEKDGWERT